MAIEKSEKGVIVKTFDEPPSNINWIIVCFIHAFFLLTLMPRICFALAFKESFASLGLLSKKASLASLPFEERRKRRKKEEQSTKQMIQFVSNFYVQFFITYKQKSLLFWRKRDSNPWYKKNCTLI